MAQLSIQEKYFGNDWMEIGKDFSKNEFNNGTSADINGAPTQTEDDPIDVQHNPAIHMYLTLKAYAQYSSQFEGGELAKYIGAAAGDKPASDDHDTVVAGAFEEDKAYKNPFNEVAPELRHFWNWDGGAHAGMAGYDSGVNRSQKFFTGGFGLDGAYDKNWSENSGKLRGAKGLGSEALYRAGDKGKAYWYLGHVAHLVEDITVPAHALLWPHVLPGTEAYEHYIKDYFGRWNGIPNEPVERFDSVYELFLETAKITTRFDTGSGPGSRGMDGSMDRGSRRAGGFTQAELDAEGDVLVPLAVRRVAALFLYFYKRVDQAPPRVTLAEPEAAPGGKVFLSACAEDEISGVDRTGYRFLYRELAGQGWTPWRPISPETSGPAAEFRAEGGKLYGFKAEARDAAGNAAESPTRTFRAPDLLLAAAQ